MNIADETILNVAYKFLTNGDKTTKELKEHLQGKGFPQDEILSACEFLVLKGYLSDSRYTVNYIRKAILKRKGKNRIVAELIEKGIPESTISQSMLSDDLNDFFSWEYQAENANLEVNKLVKGNNNIEKKLITKVVNKLTYLGYEEDIIQYIFEKLKLESSDFQEEI